MNPKRYINVIRTKMNIPTVIEDTKIHFPRGYIKFYCPTFMEMWRVDTLYTKEPETIAWIDAFQKNSVLWDIGANVGTYTIYAAMKEHYVISFEPSTREFEILRKNVELNHVWGKTENIYFDDRIDLSAYPQPDYIKIDTDGNEIKILQALDKGKILSLVKQVSIEVEPAIMREVIEIMSSNLLVLKSKTHAPMHNGTPYEIYDNAIFERLSP